MEEYGAHLETEAKDTRYHQQYICGSNDYYEEIARYEARFNRLLMYPGDVLHAPTIPADFDFSPSFSSGRLTLNTFIHLK